ncbi:MAG: hypothetical protein IRY85_17930 [Micromonosporaceae bacterium]|nr:hypothetical protein [Micromonosporaceae bacterium]
MGQSGGSMLARGGSPLAATLMMLLGLFHILSGIAAIARANFYTVGGNYPYRVDNVAWAWIHVIGGALVAISGLTLFSRSAAARWIAIVLASVSLVINFFFLPYFPLWSLLMIPLAIFAIWAVVRDGSEQRQREAEMSQRMAGAFAAQTGQMQRPGERREPMAATYGEPQTGQRWPENVGAREGQQQGEGRWSPADMKESASRAGERMQEQTAARARSGQQQGRNAAEEAAERARQSANRDYRAGS